MLRLTVSLGVRPLVPSQLAKDREVCIAPGTSSRYLTTNSVHKSSCIEIYYQQGLQVRTKHTHKPRRKLLFTFFFFLVSAVD